MIQDPVKYNFNSCLLTNSINLSHRLYFKCALALLVFSFYICYWLVSLMNASSYSSNHNSKSVVLFLFSFFRHHVYLSLLFILAVDYSNQITLIIHLDCLLLEQMINLFFLFYFCLKLSFCLFHVRIPVFCLIDLGFY